MNVVRVTRVPVTADLIVSETVSSSGAAVDVSHVSGLLCLPSVR